MTDIYDGDHICAWVEDGLVFLTFFMNGVSISILEEDFPQVMAELVKVQASFQTMKKEVKG